MEIGTTLYFVAVIAIPYDRRPETLDCIVDRRPETPTLTLLDIVSEMLDRIGDQDTILLQLSYDGDRYDTVLVALAIPYDGDRIIKIRRSPYMLYAGDRCNYCNKVRYRSLQYCISYHTTKSIYYCYSCRTTENNIIPSDVRCNQGVVFEK